tara:strand:+ start:8738 stop:9226 length:489 start_codon:yes stop_codon:yes gene_type:complete
MHVRLVCGLLVAILNAAHAGGVAPHPLHITCVELSEWYYDTQNNGTQACCDRPPSYLRTVSPSFEEHAVMLFHDKPRESITWPSNAAFDVAWDVRNTTALVRFPNVDNLAPFVVALFTYSTYLFFPTFPSVLLHVARSRTDPESLVPTVAGVVPAHVGVFVR